MRTKWQGVFPAVTTQFRKDQSLDLKATARHLEALIDSGVTGLILCGSLAENQALEPEEKRRVIEMAVKTSQGRVPVLSGVTETSTATACRYARDCEKLGADTASCSCRPCSTKGIPARPRPTSAPWRRRPACRS